MFQSFERRSNPEKGAVRLKAVRKELDEHGLDGFLVPRADAHQGEFVAKRDERLAWLTGFTGSAGLAIVTRDKAAVFVDGRYELQVRDQIDLDHFDALGVPEVNPGEWLCDAVKGQSVIGYDPWLHTRKQARTLPYTPSTMKPISKKDRPQDRKRTRRSAQNGSTKR